MVSGVVVVGAGQAACQAIASLRQMRYEGTITLIGEEKYLPYQRPPLSKGFLKGDVDPETLCLRPVEFYERTNCDVRLGLSAVAIDRNDQVVVLANGEMIQYEALILAIGARARAYPGLDKSVAASVHYLRSYDHGTILADRIANATKVAVIGGGYVGMEVAATARELGLEPTIYESSSRIMQRSVGSLFSSWIQDIHTAHAVDVCLDAKITSIERDSPTGSFSVSTKDGVERGFDIVLIGIGAQANIELAAEAGVKCSRGIIVDAHCATSDPRIFAIGDCCEQDHPVYGPGFCLESVQNAIDQAKCAAAAIAGRPAPLPTVPWFWSDQYGHRIQVAGVTADYDEQIVQEGQNESHPFKGRAVWYLKRGRVIAIETLDAPEAFMLGRSYIKSQRPVSVDALFPQLNHT
ncbi:MAG TPA: hypothetical protein DEB15_11780 [Pusillimonas sp.]|jgi:3-phenylpropionate/trans-cinnamate dioxygenase ferredoxin reductase subunit|nr:hypothetical protein [Pusillimonas sp.]|tara:strand:+ start:30822 stop:32045 length:1224 start_codon:yes stop_codon:yes gene_type:complete